MEYNWSGICKYNGQNTDATIGKLEADVSPEICCALRPSLSHGLPLSLSPSLACSANANDGIGISIIATSALSYSYSHSIANHFCRNGLTINNRDLDLSTVSEFVLAKGRESYASLIGFQQQ